jgi:hypothetical protein
MVTFRYRTGEDVQIGDQIEYDGHPGIITDIFQPNTPHASDFACPDTGGIMLKSIWGPMVLPPPDGESWEDLDFIQRQVVTA